MRTESTKTWNVQFWFLSGERINRAGECLGQCAYQAQGYQLDAYSLIHHTLEIKRTISI